MARKRDSTVAEDIVRLLRRPGRSLTDAELAAKTGRTPQTINQAARSLESKGETIRQRGPDGAIRNIARTKVGRITALTMKRTNPATRRVAEGEPITEDQVKQEVKDHLEAQRWRVEVAWGRAPGVDIEAKRRGERLLIEAKGEVVRSAQQVNYFLGALGELIQRMDDPKATYGLALPDNSQYRGLVSRLPGYAIERLGLVVFWVSGNGKAVEQSR